MRTNPLEHDERVRDDRRYRALVEQAPDMILVIDSDGLVSLASGGVEAQLDRPADSLLGKRLLEFVHPEDVLPVRRLLTKARDRRPSQVSAKYRMTRRDGSFAHVEAMAADRTRDADVRGIVLRTRDVSERQALEERLRHHASHDPLTHLPNRALFDDRLAGAVAQERRKDRFIGVLLIDLDDFKELSDSLGQAAGDRLLIGLAGRLRGCLRSGETAARLRGDEFGVVLKGLRSRHDASLVAQRVLEKLREPFLMYGDPMRLKPSIGVAAAAGGSARAERLVREADVAMYLAKENGKDRYEVYDRELHGGLRKAIQSSTADPTDEANGSAITAVERSEIEVLLEDEDSILPVFQPIVDLATGTVAGYEALARFPAPPDHPPGAWFAQAHRCGVGVELELLALRSALRVDGRPPGTYLSLNLSPSVVVSGRLEENLPEDISSLVFEIVETELISRGTRLEAALDRLRSRGARIAVDDMGSAYADLKQLMPLRPEIIKLDRSLVDGLHADPAKRALVGSMVRHARRIHAAVCAEGVETLEDLHTLAEIDIPNAQGYVLARPAPPWPRVDPAAAQVCASSVRAAMGELLREPGSDSAAEQRLEHVFWSR